MIFHLFIKRKHFSRNFSASRDIILAMERRESIVVEYEPYRYTPPTEPAPSPNNALGIANENWDAMTSNQREALIAERRRMDSFEDRGDGLVYKVARPAPIRVFHKIHRAARQGTRTAGRQASQRRTASSRSEGGGSDSDGPSGSDDPAPTSEPPGGAP